MSTEILHDLLREQARQGGILEGIQRRLDEQGDVLRGVDDRMRRVEQKVAAGSAISGGLAGAAIALMVEIAKGKMGL